MRNQHAFFSTCIINLVLKKNMRVKGLLSTMFLPSTNSNHPGWLYVETDYACVNCYVRMYVLGLWFANTASAKIVTKRIIMMIDW